MKSDLVSILIVSYDAEQYIKKTIKSCLDQTYENFEILLLDNASKDGTIDILKNIQKEDKRLQIFESKENLGPYMGLNFLLEKATGEYIAIQDHDDIWLPGKIEKQVQFLKENQDYIACGTNTYYFHESKKMLILNEKKFDTSFVDHTSLMFRNKGFRYDVNYVLADEHFEKKVLGQNGKISCLKEPLTIHRLKKDGSNFSLIRFEISIKNIKEFFELNSFTVESTMYLIHLFCAKHFLSEKIVWFIRRNITLKYAKWINLNEFKKRHPYIDL